MPTFVHQPVLLREVIHALRPQAQGRYVDGTLGGGSHAFAILEASSPTGWLDGFDQDGAAIEAARQRLSGFEGRFALHRDNFANMARWIEPGSCDGILMDLGVSSHQLDTADRGFSFQQEGPLDMRMDDRATVTAADLVQEASAQELERIFRELGEEPQARRFARAIAQERERQRFTTTGQLAGFIERMAPRHGKKRHPATRIFQALRMATNFEVEALQRALAAACTLLRPGGRVAVITFHSIEDRIVKRFGIEHTRDYTFDGDVDVPELRRPCPALLRWVERKPVLPGDEEILHNPRARSAKMRVLEKI